jgi:4-hydroxy-3-methylbut-2-en-1-yl diphosphate reductase
MGKKSQINESAASYKKQAAMTEISLKKIIIAEYYGFCMGVEKAILTTREAMHHYKKVTILNEIVHNDAVVNEFSRAGVGRSTSIEKIKDGTVIISAHGASPEIFRKAKLQGLKIVDATCPLVIRIHKIVKKLAEDGYFIIHFGDPEHDETVGIVGHAPERMIVIHNRAALDTIKIDSEKIALTAQTTARVSDFEEIEKAVREKYPQVKVFNTICNATTQRQAAIMQLAPKVDLMLVVGSKTSANSKRLVQISEAVCGRSFLIDSADDILPEWLMPKGKSVETIGLTAGASTPDFLIDGAIDKLKSLAGHKVEIVYSKKRKRSNKLLLQNDTV